MGKKQALKIERREVRRVLGEAAVDFMNKVSEGTTQNHNELGNVKAAVDEAYTNLASRVTTLEALVIRPTFRRRLKFLFLGR